MENHGYEDVDSSPSHEEVLPQIRTTQLTTFVPPPSEGVSAVQPASEAMLPLYDMSSLSVGAFTMVPLPDPTNNYDMIQKPPSEYNPEWAVPEVSVPSVPKMLPQPLVDPSPGLAGETWQSTLPGSVVSLPAQQISVVNIYDDEIPYYRDYLPWSIFNLLCCCLIFGIVALTCSILTRSARTDRDWRSAKTKSRMALGFNMASTVLGISFIIAVVSLYYTSPKLFTTYIYSSNYPHYG